MSEKLSDSNGPSSPESTSLLDNGEHLDGVSVFMASVLFVACEVGLGSLALPEAMSETGWGGVAILPALVICLSYTAIMLNWCWMIIIGRKDNLCVDIKYPYAYIAENAIGKKARVFTSILILITAYGGCVVVILLSSEIVHALISPLWSGSTECLWIVIVTVSMLPLTWFNKIEQYWPLSVVSNLAISAVIVGVVVDIIFVSVPSYTPVYSNPDAESIFLGISGFLYTVADHMYHPSLMRSMRNPGKFPYVVFISYTFATVVYLIITVCGYYRYGDDVTSNIILSLQTSWVTRAMDITVVLYVWAVFILPFNIVTLEVEEQVKWTESSIVVRLLVRLLLLSGVLFICLTLPNFYNVLPVIGAATMSTLSLIWPPILYYRLCNHPDFSKIYIPFYTKLCMLTLVVEGAVIVVIGTYSAIMNIVDNSSIDAPCYVTWH